MNLNHESLRAVLMHPAVARAMHGIGRTPALELLIKARVSRRNIIRGHANAREDAAWARRVERRDGTGAAWEAGASFPPSADQESNALKGIMRRMREALEAEGLPDDLRAMITRALESER